MVTGIRVLTVVLQLVCVAVVCGVYRRGMSFPLLRWMWGAFVAMTLGQMGHRLVKLLLAPALTEPWVVVEAGCAAVATLCEGVFVLVLWRLVRFREPWPVHGMPVAVLVMNTASTILTWNAAAERLLGWSATEAVGQDLAALVLPVRTQALYRREMARWTTTPQPERFLGIPLAVMVRHKDQTELWVLVHVTPVQVAGGAWEFIVEARRGSRS